MYQIKLYAEKGEDPELIWITKEENEGIKKLLQDGAKFITLSRLDKTINSRDVKEVGIPNFIKPMLDKGYEVRMDENGRPVVQGEGYILSWSGDRWDKIHTSVKREYRTFEDYLKQIKRLN